MTVSTCCFFLLRIRRTPRSTRTNTLFPYTTFCRIFEFVEETLDDVAITVEKASEGGDVLARRHGLDVGPGASGGEPLAHGVAVVGAVGEQDLARPESIQHVLGRASVMRLTGRQLELHGPAVGIDKGMYLGRQPAPRTPHAHGSKVSHTGGDRTSTRLNSSH